MPPRRRSSVLTPPPAVLSSPLKKEIRSLAALAAVPGAEKMSAEFVKSYGLKTRPADEEEGKARVEFFKSLIKVDKKWSDTTLVNVGLAFPKPRQVMTRGRKELNEDPCSRCKNSTPPIPCMMTVVDDGLSVKNYCDPCSQSKSKCSIGPARIQAAVALGASVGSGLRGMGTQLRAAGFRGDGPLRTAEQLMRDMLSLLKTTVPVAWSAVVKSLGDVDVETQKMSESVVNPSSAPSFSQSGYPSGRSYTPRGPSVKREFHGRDSASVFGSPSKGKGKGRAVSEDEEDSEERRSEEEESEEREASPSPPRPSKKPRQGGR